MLKDHKYFHSLSTQNLFIHIYVIIRMEKNFPISFFVTGCGFSVTGAEFVQRQQQRLFQLKHHLVRLARGQHHPLSDLGCKRRQQKLSSASSNSEVHGEI